MRTSLFIVLLSFIIHTISFAQSSEDGPLADSYIIQIGGGDELVTLNNEGVNIYKYYKAMELYSRDTLVHTMHWPDDYLPYDWQDIELQNFDNDESNEILVVAKSNSFDMIEIVLLKVDPSLMIADPENAWDKVIHHTKTISLYQPRDWQLKNGIFIRSGNFDADSLKEFFVAYWAADGKVEIALFDVTDSLQISELDTIRTQVIAEPPDMRLCEDWISLYEIDAIDFNNDGIDEIFIGGRQENPAGGWQIFCNVYSYNDAAGELELNVSAPLYTQTDVTRDVGYFKIGGGHFFNADYNSAVAGFLEYSPDHDAAGPNDYILVPFNLNEQMNDFMVGDTILQRENSDEGCYERSGTLKAVDINNDGTDELLSAFSYAGVYPTFKIYTGLQPLQFAVYADLDKLHDQFSAVMVCGNFDTEPEEQDLQHELIIRAGHSFFPQATEIYKIKTKSDRSFDALELLNIITGSINDSYGSNPPLAGNIDADIRLGKPKRYSVSEILQPLVILNAPPIHFDVFDGQSYDICKSFNEYESDFIASYIKETLQSTEVQTEVNKDWSISSTMSGGFSFWGMSVSSHLTQKYGKKFSKIEGSSQSIKVGFEATATVDDQIYATVMDYDVWEYPVYGNSVFRGNVLVVEPLIVRNSWFDSKSWKGYSYIPEHEVGNILSYRRYPNLMNPMLDQKIKGDYGFDTSFLLSGNSSFDWFLNFQNFEDASASTTRECSTDWGVSVSFWGAGFSLDGSYSSQDIQTQRTSVESGIYMNVHLDAVDMSMGETRYEVTPYAYWANNGALVIDYAVAPEIAGPGGEDTWWDTHYGYLPDPAFILPWRYDPEKGNDVSEAKRQQTKDIVFKPQDPKEGEVITIYANIHNFSLLPTPGPVGIKFYVGDPDSSGMLIIGENGLSEVFTNGPIDERGKTQVALQWKVPIGIGTFPRIYAVLDEADGITEIHESNNKSWSILQKSTNTVGIEPAADNLPVQFTLKQNYPNPFNPLTRIDFSIPQTEKVSLDVFNPLGQKVATLIEKQLPAGRHSLEFNAQRLSSGIYYYILQAGPYRQMKKMVLIK